MKEKRYEDLSHTQARAALEEFLTERDPALRWLEDHVGPEVVLDGTVESPIPLWQWVKPRVSDREGEFDGTGQPTWSRYGLGSIEVLETESWPVVDGLISYVVDVIQTQRPDVRWVLDMHPNPRYGHQNKPALELGRWRKPVADVVANRCRNIPGDKPPSDEQLAEIVQGWIATITVEQANSSVAIPDNDHELFEVVDLRAEDGDRHRPRDPDFEIGLDDWLAGTHPKLLGTLRKALSKEPGVNKVVEEDREVLLVHAPDWDQQRLADWVSKRLPRTS